MPDTDIIKEKVTGMIPSIPVPMSVQVEASTFNMDVFLENFSSKELCKCADHSHKFEAKLDKEEGNDEEVVMKDIQVHEPKIKIKKDPYKEFERSLPFARTKPGDFYKALE